MQTWCPTCQRENNSEAVYCSYCGGMMPAETAAPQGGAPNTGSTIDLGRDQKPWVLPASTPEAASPSLVVPPAPVQSRANTGNSWNWVLIGIVLFFVMPRIFWVIGAGFGLIGRMWWLIPLFFFLSRGHRRRGRHQRNPGPWVMLLMLAGVTLALIA